jgi:hypothetical protein
MQLTPQIVSHSSWKNSQILMPSTTIEELMAEKEEK